MHFRVVYLETSLEARLLFTLKQMRSRVPCPASSGLQGLVSRGQTAVPRRGLSIVDYKRPGAYNLQSISPCAEQRSGHARLCKDVAHSESHNRSLNASIVYTTKMLGTTGQQGETRGESRTIDNIPIYGRTQVFIFLPTIFTNTLNYMGFN